MALKTISFVLPVYNEEAGIAQFYAELTRVLSRYRRKYNFELLFINDGSRDRSIEILEALSDQDKRVRVLSFSRNFGHQIAITAGMDHATGDAIIIMDTDLQDPPEVAMQMVRKWEEGYAVVYGQRRTRKDRLFKRASAAAFYRLINRLTPFHIPLNTGDFRLMDRQVVDVMTQFRESNRYMRGLVSFVGFRQTPVVFDRDPRFAGETHYPMRKMLKLAFDGILSFSTAPLRLIIQLGLLVSIISFLGILYALFMYFFHPDVVVPGWTFIMVSILFIGGVQMIMVGIVGAYVGRIYSEVQRRPLYILDHTAKHASKKR